MIIVEDLLRNENFSFLSLKSAPATARHKISGFNQIVNPQNATSIHPNELLLIAVNEDHDQQTFISQIEKMFKCNSIAGLVLKTNSRDYQIPEEIIELGNQTGIAVLEIPWNIRVADFTRDVIEMILKDQTSHDLVKHFFSELIFNDFKVNRWPFEITEALEAEVDDTYSVFIARHESNRENRQKELEVIEYFLVTELRKHFPHFIYSQINSFIFFILKDQPGEEKFFNNFLSELEVFQEKYDVTCTKGGGGYYLAKIGESYQEARKVRLINQASLLKDFFAYEELGIYKLLLEIDNNDILSKFHQQALGPLIAYDQATNQHYYDFLKQYFHENGKHSAVSESLFLHQNTVAYRLKRISEILDVDLKTFDGLIYIGIALAIEDLLGIEKAIQP